MIGLINAEKIIRYRNEKPFESVKDFAYYCKYNLRLSDSTINEITNMITTKSENFLIEGKISMSDHNFSFSTIINHDLDGSRFLKQCFQTPTCNQRELMLRHSFSTTAAFLARGPASASVLREFCCMICATYTQSTAQTHHHNIHIQSTQQ